MQIVEKRAPAGSLMAVDGTLLSCDFQSDMARERLPETHQTGRRRRSAASLPMRGMLPPNEPLRQSPKDVLFSTWPGRLFLITAGLKVFVAVWRAFGELPAPIRVLSGAASIGLAVAVGVFVWRLFVLMKRTLLWRVRRKLILSYIFIGVVPSLLIIVFFLFCSAVLFMGVAAYLFKSGYDKVVDDVKVVAQAAALEISRNPTTARADGRASAPDSDPVNIRRCRSSTSRLMEPRIRRGRGSTPRPRPLCRPG